MIDKRTLTQKVIRKRRSLNKEVVKERMMKGVYNYRSGQIRTAHGVEDWFHWSIIPHTKEEIIDKALHDYDSICFSYVCRYSTIPTDFLLEFMALSTNLLIDNKYYDKDLEKIIDVLLHKQRYLKNGQVKIYLSPESVGQGPRKVYVENINDKMDWFYLAQYQEHIPEDIITKYSVL